MYICNASGRNSITGNVTILTDIHTTGQKRSIADFVVKAVLTYLNNKRSYNQGKSGRGKRPTGRRLRPARATSMP